MSTRSTSTLPLAETGQATVVETVDAVHAGRLTARACVEAALARIARLDDRVNALTRVRVAEALAEADAVDADPHLRRGPLAGVPVAVKCELDVAGEVTTIGGRANATPATADAEVVRRLRAAGAVVVGMTTMPELGQFPFSESARYGTTDNPAAPGHTTGGSSGGSAAAVASGMVPVAVGADGGGSIRIPSSCCGLVGLKASRGRVSTAPEPESWLGLCTPGPITRTVADQALVHDAIDGNAATDRHRLPLLDRPLAGVATADPAPLRVGWTVQAPTAAIRVDDEVAAAVEAVATRLAALGHHVDALAGRLPNQLPAYLPQMYEGMRRVARGTEHPELLEARTRQSLARARVVASPPALAMARAATRRTTAAVDALLAEHDVLLLPTMACLPPRLGQLDAVGALRGTLAAAPLAAFTSLTNVTGHPSVSLPLGRSVSGLPIGVQLVGPAGRDDLVLQLAAQLERVVGWA